MPVRIRLARFGRKKLAMHRIVVAPSECKRDGRHLEIVGTVNPHVNPPLITIKEDRVKYWIGVGAQATETVESIIKRTMPKYLEGVVDGRVAKVRASRAKRKARNKVAAAK